MNFWRFFLSLFLTVGIVVAVVSLYNASVIGTMGKLGLVGSDFQAGILRDKLDINYLIARGELKCGLVNRVSGAVRFLLSSDNQQGELAFVLGEQRILCGAGMIASGQVEEGTYEVIKGMGYLKDGYTFVYERAEIEPRVCSNLPDLSVDIVTGKLIEGTSGRVYELLFDEWTRVIELRRVVDTICT